MAAFLPILGSTFIRFYLKDFMTLCGIENYPADVNKIQIKMPLLQPVEARFYGPQQVPAIKIITGDNSSDVWRKLKAKYPNALADHCTELTILIRKTEAVKITQTNLLLVEHSDDWKERE